MVRSIVDCLWRGIDDDLPALLMAIITAMISVDVFLRDAAGAHIPNGVEIATYAFVWSVFLGAAGASRRGDHFHVDLVQNSLSGRPRVISFVLVDAFCCVVAAMMTVSSWQYTMRSWRRVSEGLEMPLGYFYMVFPIAFALMALAHGCHAYRNIFRRNSP
ncbi:TRAP transporter small permease [Microvirga lotononidis]|uniref:TRAP transporter small permease protein n=1 Tax=Microvirga lotononidis TaxID=864069 RepID=I4YQZ1_9HYPH|nr:TRAP transporter small permease [Microvirga lotononidis]EIM26383.1 TRAP-type C4-dicarboxylate transport system, small permease component [Microvirga lotononidis]WQO30748.1 TRAP transporter small permease [Microvirga lotononidis]